jgi:hypothetical protein
MQTTEAAPADRARASAHELLDALSEREVHAAWRYLAYLLHEADPAMYACLTSEYDDEPDNEDERQAAQEAWEQYEAGEYVELDALKNDLGL